MDTIYEYTTKAGRTRYVIADYSEQHNQYTATMTRESRQLTGCYAVYAPTIEALVSSGNIQTYSTKGAAKRALLRQEATP